MFAAIALAALLQDYSSLDTPPETPVSWRGYYVADRKFCKDESYVEGVYIERKGLHFYEAAALAQRIVWVDQDKELYIYGLLGGEGAVGPAKYRIKRADDGRSIRFYGGESADNENAKGDLLLKCPE